jgi:hypothetical protein
MNILRRGETEMFTGRDVAEEIGTRTGCYSTTNGTGDMVITRCDIRNKRAKYIKRRSVAETFLEFNVGFDLIERYMARTFDHHLNSLIPGPLSEFSEEK